MNKTNQGGITRVKHVPLKERKNGWMARGGEDEGGWRCVELGEVRVELCYWRDRYINRTPPKYRVKSDNEWYSPPDSKRPTNGQNVSLEIKKCCVQWPLPQGERIRRRRREGGGKGGCRNWSKWSKKNRLEGWFEEAKRLFSEAGDYFGADFHHGQTVYYCVLCYWPVKITTALIWLADNLSGLLTTRPAPTKPYLVLFNS